MNQTSTTSPKQLRLKKMGRAILWFCSVWLAAALLSVSQAQDTACLNQLMPCLEYINSNNTPTTTCCNPLTSLIKSDPKCLCSMLGGSSSARQAGINMTQAEMLPAKCGLKVTAASCTGVDSPTAKAAIPSSASRRSFLGPVVTCGILTIIQISWVSAAGFHDHLRS